MKILVLGCNGQIGRCLIDQLVSTDYSVTFASREKIDITDFEATGREVLDIAPDVVINAAAYTAVDMAEEDHQTANLLNHLAVENIALICSQRDCWLIHISTDYVFDGNSCKPYTEDDSTNPQCVYGESKLKGELAIQASGCKHIIIRTAWVFSEYGNNFLRTMLRLGADRNVLRVVGDQVGCPTYAQDIAKAIVCMLGYLIDDDVTGVYHFSGDEQCSWFDFGLEIFQKAEGLGYSVPINVESISTLEYPTLAERPAYSVLDSHKCLKVFGIAPSDWRAGILYVLIKLKQGG